MRNARGQGGLPVYISNYEGKNLNKYIKIVVALPGHKKNQLKPLFLTIFNVRIDF